MRSVSAFSLGSMAEDRPEVIAETQPTASCQGDTAARLSPIDIPDRYEFKYVVPEWQVDEVRRAIEPFCVLDPNSARSPNHEYPIQSLYLDTFNRDLYRISRERRGRRWKARVRHYDGSDTVFLEVKNKDHDMVKKPRAKIPLAGWAERVRGSLHDGACSAEQLFCQRLMRYGLVPTLMVRYQREAWLSTVDSYARVTFDRRIMCQPWSEWSLDADPNNWVALDGAQTMLGVPRGVVLELKCLSAVPRWLSNVANSIGLQKIRYSKYCRGIERMFARDTLIGVLNQT
jgi:SPX domain protein involved in polyphosphate accumulation